MPTDPASTDVAVYAAAIRAELAGLAPTERDTLLEDLEDHLAEVAAESDATLTERLGSPAAYAAELVAAYGAGRPERRTTLRSLQDWAQGHAAYRSVRGFLPELRPAWWVFRAYLAVMVLVMIVSPGTEIRPVPNPLTKHGLAQLIMTVVAIMISVWLGRRFRPTHRPVRYLSLAANGLVAVLGLVALNSLGQGMTGTPYPDTYSYVYAGSATTNLYPYSLDGRPLSDVLLYDQDGRPLTLGAKGDGMVITQYPTAADGQPITNSYPLQQRHFDGSPVQAPRVALPPVVPTPTGTPTARPTP